MRVELYLPLMSINWTTRLTILCILVGPAAHWYVGNVLEMVKVGSHEALRRWSVKYGDVFVVSIDLYATVLRQALCCQSLFLFSCNEPEFLSPHGNVQVLTQMTIENTRKTARFVMLATAL